MSKTSQNNLAAAHASFFATTDGTLTAESMKLGHHCQGIHKGVFLKTKAIQNMLHGKPSTAQQVGSIHNPASTGIWTKDGQFDRKEFNKLTARAHKVKGELVVTKQMFHDHLASKHRGKSLGNACHVFYIVPVPWTTVTKGSFDELFEHYSDASYHNQPAIKVSTLLEFYTQPVRFMQAKAQAMKLAAE